MVTEASLTRAGLQYYREPDAQYACKDWSYTDESKQSIALNVFKKECVMAILEQTDPNYKLTKDDIAKLWGYVGLPSNFNYYYRDFLKNYLNTTLSKLSSSAGVGTMDTEDLLGEIGSAVTTLNDVAGFLMNPVNWF